MEVQRKTVIVRAVVLNKYFIHEGKAEWTLKAAWNFQCLQIKKNSTTYGAFILCQALCKPPYVSHLIFAITQ